MHWKQENIVNCLRSLIFEGVSGSTKKVSIAWYASLKEVRIPMRSSCGSIGIAEVNLQTSAYQRVPTTHQTKEPQRIPNGARGSAVASIHRVKPTQTLQRRAPREGKLQLSI